MRRNLFILLLAFLTTPCFAAARQANMVQDPGFELASAAWVKLPDGGAVDSGVRKGGRQSLRCEAQGDNGSYGFKQVINLKKPVCRPLVVSGWSKAKGVNAVDYSIWLDIHYEDGTPLWGQRVLFSPGTHDWEYKEGIIDVAKPVKQIELFVFVRKGRGVAWFDDVRVAFAPMGITDLRALPGLYGGAGIDVSGMLAFPGKWDVSLMRGAKRLARRQGAEQRIRASFTEADNAPGRYSVVVTATANDSGETVQRKLPVRVSPAKRRRGYALWTESSMVRVMPGALPVKVPTEAPLARIALARGEAESFQVVLLPAPGRSLRGVRVRLGDLVRRDGKARIAAANLEWQQVGYVNVKLPWRHPLVKDLSPGWWPDPLLPVQRFDVASGFTQPVWVTLTAPRTTAPGEYTGKLEVLAEGEAPTTVRISARVYRAVLPEACRLKNAFALMDGFLEKVYGELTPELRRAYDDFVLRHRLNPDDISRTAPPLPDEIARCYSRMNAYNLMNMVEERGKHAWVCNSAPQIYTPAFKEQVLARLDPAAQELRRRGLLGKAYLYTFDERGEEYFPIMADFFGMIKQRYPEVYTLTTAYIGQDLKKMQDLHVDAICPITSVYDYDKAEAIRRGGRQVWSYVALGPRYPYANFLIEDPLIEGRVIGWQAYREKMDGFLYWGLNIWSREHNDHPIDPDQGAFLEWGQTTGGIWPRLNGDGVLLYPGKNGPIGSIRLANIRDGFEDYDLLSLLAEKKGSVEAARAACLPVTRGLALFTRDPQTLLKARDAVAAQLEK